MRTHLFIILEELKYNSWIMQGKPSEKYKNDALYSLYDAAFFSAMILSVLSEYLYGIRGHNSYKSLVRPQTVPTDVPGEKGKGRAFQREEEQKRKRVAVDRVAVDPGSDATITSPLSPIFDSASIAEASNRKIALDRDRLDFDKTKLEYQSKAEVQHLEMQIRASKMADLKLLFEIGDEDQKKTAREMMLSLIQASHIKN